MDASDFFLFFPALLLAGLAYLIHNKKQYSFLSGFGSLPKEEQEELMKNGYTLFMGRFLWGIAILWMVGVVTLFFNIVYIFEIIILLFLISIFAGMLYSQKYVKKERRKRNILIISSLSIIVFIGLGILVYFSEKETTVEITDGIVEIDGMYDYDFSIVDIEKIQLIDELPEIKMKTNAYATSTRMVGTLMTEDYGSGRYYVYVNNPPYIWIETVDRHIVINYTNEEKTKQLFDKFNETWQKHRE